MSWLFLHPLNQVKEIHIDKDNVLNLVLLDHLPDILRAGTEKLFVQGAEEEFAKFIENSFRGTSDHLPERKAIAIRGVEALFLWRFLVHVILKGGKSRSGPLLEPIA